MFEQGSVVKVSRPDGQCRVGHVELVQVRGSHILVCFHEEVEKIREWEELERRGPSRSVGEMAPPMVSDWE